MDSIVQLSRSRNNYYWRFLSDGATGIGLIVLSYVLLNKNKPVYIFLYLLAGLTAGLVIQGFIEYVFHRWFFHVIKSKMVQGHREHHEQPMAYMSLPWVISLFLFVVLWLFFLLITQTAALASIITAGIGFTMSIFITELAFKGESD